MGRTPIQLSARTKCSGTAVRIIVAQAEFVARCCGVATQKAGTESISRKSVQRFCDNDVRKTKS